NVSSYKIASTPKRPPRAAARSGISSATAANSALGRPVIVSACRLPMTPQPTTAMRILPVPSMVGDALVGQQFGESLGRGAEKVGAVESAEPFGESEMRLHREESVESVVAQRPNGFGQLAVAGAGRNDRAVGELRVLDLHVFQMRTQYRIPVRERPYSTLDEI